MSGLIAYDPKIHALDLSTGEKVKLHLASLLRWTRGHDGSTEAEMIAALVPWLCNRCKSELSRREYLQDIKSFRDHMEAQGISLLSVTADDVIFYVEALRRTGQKSSTIATALSAIRGMYREFGKKGLVDWETVGNIQAVESPRVTKNSTPRLSEREACKLLHAPDTETLAGLRDHAMLFVFFRTGCRSSAIANAKVGHVERTDTDYYLRVTEKGSKVEVKSLLEAAPILLRYMEAGGIRSDPDGPLFRPLSRDKKTLLRKHMARQDICALVKKYARQVGIDVDRIESRGVCTHSLRKTVAMNALEHGADIMQVKALLGHAHVSTTQVYHEANEKDAEKAARHIQIR